MYGKVYYFVPHLRAVSSLDGIFHPGWSFGQVGVEFADHLRN